MVTKCIVLAVRHRGDRSHAKEEEGFAKSQ